MSLPAQKRPRNVVHDAFIAVDAISVRCRYCFKVYRNHGNTTNLKEHIRRKHPGHAADDEGPPRKKPCDSQMPAKEVGHDNPSEEENNPEIMELEQQSPSKNSNARISQIARRSRSMSPATCSTSTSDERIARPRASSLTPLQRQLSIDNAFEKVKSYTDGGSTASKITNAIVYMIAVDRQPFSVVEDKGFKKLLNVLAPLYTIPCRKTITARTDEKCELLSGKIKTVLSKVRHLSLTTDIWTDPFNTRSYLGVTVHHVNFDNMRLEEISLGMKELEQSHTAEYLSQVLIAVLDEWHIDINSVVAVVTDNAANIVKSVYDTFGHQRHLPCFAHTLNLAVQGSISATPEFQAVIKKVKTIVTYCKRSVKAADGLQELQKSDLREGDVVLKLKQECETRWNSMYYMIERFVKLANHVSTVLINLPRKRNDVIPDMITHSELQILKDASAILAPVEKVTTEMSGESYVTSSKIIPIVNCLTKSLEKLTTEHEVSERLRNNVLKELTRRFHAEASNIEKHSSLAISTLLDPRYKKIHFRSPLAVANAVSKITQLIKQNQKEDRPTTELPIRSPNVTEKEDNLWDIHDQLIVSTSSSTDEPGGVPVEFRQYLNASVTNRHQDPLTSWQRLKDVYPNVYEVAMKYFVIVGTSVPSERLFSAAGDIVSAKRSRLKGKRASDIIFLGSLAQRYWE